MKNETDSDPLDLNGFEEEVKKAKLREENRDAMRNTLMPILEKISEAEAEAASQQLSYKYQYELAKSKSAIVKILKSLEEESNAFHERNYLSTV